MTNLPIHLTTHHLRLSDALSDFVSKKIAGEALRTMHSPPILSCAGTTTPGGASRPARFALPGWDV